MQEILIIITHVSSNDVAKTRDLKKKIQWIREVIKETCLYLVMHFIYLKITF